MLRQWYRVHEDKDTSLAEPLAVRHLSQQMGTADDFYTNDKIYILQKFPLNTQPTLNTHIICLYRVTVYIKAYIARTPYIANKGG